MGGLEKSICRFSNAFVQRGHEVTVITYDEHDGNPFYPLDKRVTLINLRKSIRMTRIDKGIREFYRLFGHKAVRYWKVAYQRKTLPSDFFTLASQLKPDVILAYGTMSAGEVSRSGIQIPWVTCFRNDPNILCQDLLSYEKIAVEKSAAIQVLLPSFREQLAKYIKNDRVVFIPNAVNTNTPEIKTSVRKERFRIINVARLNKKQKKQELLIGAFALLAEKYPKWDVELWGADTSHYRKELEALVKRKHLEGRVFFQGLSHNMAPIYQNSDIFAFPSKYEGFPNALAEAMAAGLPVVGFASCPSVQDLISDGRDGVLAADGVDGLAAALERLMREPKLRQNLGVQARLAMRQYSEEKSMGSVGSCFIGAYNAQY